MKRALIALAAGTMLSGAAAVYAAMAQPQAAKPPSVSAARS